MHTKEPQYTNDLIHATSPYLLQHAHNPVQWHEWNEQTLAKARKENRLMLVSIGYSACHWCHVMAHESFEDEATAALMNEHFICIKIDREERPDIDQVYMDACQLVSGRGGWPLNAFALPDGRPVHALTYAPRQQWQTLLLQVADLWKRETGKAMEYAENLGNGIRAVSEIKTAGAVEINREMISGAYRKMAENFDHEYGGPNRAPKFPLPNQYEFLIDYYLFTKDKEVLDFTAFTLDRMALGGLYDQLGGGFARYSVDKQWFAPHFEKMLYDNAQLISLYSRMYAVTKDEFYKKIVSECIGFCNRELKHEAGAYFSSLDADSEGEEGRFYVWTYAELQAILGKDAELFCAYYAVEEGGNWEHGNNILYATQRIESFAETGSVTAEAFTETIQHCKNLLFDAREKRIRPGLDDKILCSWNGLMLQALADAYLAVKDTNYLDQASRLADFIKQNLYHDGKLKRTWKNGKARINAFIEDYAATIQGLIALYRSSYNEDYLLWANELAATALEDFYDEKAGLFHFNSKHDSELVVRKYDISDDVISSANAMMAWNLSWLAYAFAKTSWVKISENMLALVSSQVLQHPAWHSLWLRVAQLHERGVFQLEAVGENAAEQVSGFDALLYPNVLVALKTGSKASLPLLSDKEIQSETLFYVCRETSCYAPVKSLQEALRQVKDPA